MWKNLLNIRLRKPSVKEVNMQKGDYR